MSSAKNKKLGAFAAGLMAATALVTAVSVLPATQAVAQNQLQAMQMSFFYIMPSILLSGFMFPFRGMPVWAQMIGQVIPVTHFLRVIRGAMLKGEGLADMWPSLSALTAFVCVVTALAMVRYRRTLD